MKERMDKVEEDVDKLKGKDGDKDREVQHINIVVAKVEDDRKQGEMNLIERMDDSRKDIGESIDNVRKCCYYIIGKGFTNGAHSIVEFAC
jgi:hypothetical protein